MNDSHISVTSVQKVLNCEAYMLFYLRNQNEVVIDPLPHPKPVLPKQCDTKLPAELNTKSPESSSSKLIAKIEGNEYGRLKKRAPWVFYSPFRYLLNMYSANRMLLLSGIDSKAHCKSYMCGDVVLI
jgi:hypothetical protein